MKCPICKDKEIIPYLFLYKCENYNNCNFLLYKKNKYLPFELNDDIMYDLLIYKKITIDNINYVLFKQANNYVLKKSTSIYQIDISYKNIRIYEKSYFHIIYKKFIPKYFFNTLIPISEADKLFKGESILTPISKFKNNQKIIQFVTIIVENDKLKIIN